MISTRVFVVIITILTISASCNANMLEDILELIFGIKSSQRSMSEIITDILDEVFPKDDMDTKTMKNIYTMYNEEGNNLFDSQYSGLEDLRR